MGKIRKSNMMVTIVFMCLIMATIGSASAYSSISTNKNVNLVVANDLGARFNINGDNSYNYYPPPHGLDNQLTTVVCSMLLTQSVAFHQILYSLSMTMHSATVPIRDKEYDGPTL